MYEGIDNIWQKSTPFPLMMPLVKIAPPHPLATPCGA